MLFLRSINVVSNIFTHCRSHFKLDLSDYRDSTLSHAIILMHSEA